MKEFFKKNWEQIIDKGAYILIMFFVIKWTWRYFLISMDCLNLYVSRIEYQWRLEEAPEFFTLNMIYSIFAYVGLIAIAYLIDKGLKWYLKFDLFQWVLKQR